MRKEKDDDIAEEVEIWFANHVAPPDQIAKYAAILDGAKKFAVILLENAPACADQTDAFDDLHRCIRKGYAAVACQRVK